MSMAGGFDNEHSSHSNAIESEGDWTGLLTHVVCSVSLSRLSSWRFLPTIYFPWHKACSLYQLLMIELFAERCKELDAA